MWATQSQRGLWEDAGGRLELEGAENDWLNPRRGDATVNGQDAIQIHLFKIVTDHYNSSQIHSGQIERSDWTANDLMPKLARTHQIIIFLWHISVFMEGSAVRSDGLSRDPRTLSIQPLIICTEVSMRSALPNKKSAGILFCVTMTAGVVEGVAWPSPQHRDAAVKPC